MAGSVEKKSKRKAAEVDPDEDFGAALVPVGPLPSDAVYRLMSWFPALRRLSHASKVKLVAKLEGHPRAG